jgi:hypothetical protein
MIDVGQTVGNYRITAKLGEGGMGKVFLAEHPVIGRKAALKVIHPQYARNADVIARFVNEARAVNQIGHAHIVDVTDFGHTDGGDFYFIMEYLHGDMLSDCIGRVRFPPERATNIAIQIADALEASHQQGVIHRDLKPDNILLITRDDTPDFVKVYDFGLAKLTHKGSGAPTTDVGIVMGTPFYMSPEQCDGAREVDHRADIYALGVILFQMLTGRLPFTGEGFGEVMAQHLSSAPPTVRSLVPDVPPALEAIVSRAMAKDCADRFQTMAELRQALHAAARGEAAAADEPAPPSMALVKTATPPAIDLRPTHRGKASLLLGAATFVVVAVANLGLHHRAARAVMAAVTAPKQAATVLVNFSSDPAGATVSARDGSVLGVTPFSAQIPFREVPVEVVVHRDGYLTKVSSFVPNLPLPVFASLEKIPDPPALTGPTSAQGEALAEGKAAGATPERPHRHTHGRTPSKTPPPDTDDVMAPTTW